MSRDCGETATGEARRSGDKLEVSLFSTHQAESGETGETTHSAPYLVRSSDLVLLLSVSIEEAGRSPPHGENVDGRW